MLIHLDTTAVHDSLMIGSERLDNGILKTNSRVVHCELDVSNAFPSILLDDSLSEYTGLNSSLGIFVARRAMLGFSPLPAVFQQSLTSRLSAVRISPFAIKVWGEEVRKAALLDLEIDRSQGLIPSIVRNKLINHRLRHEF